MKIALFLTTGRQAARELLTMVRTRWPSATVVAFANDEDRSVLQRAAPGVEIRRDKPPGGKWAFVRGLRGERFDLAVAAWHGGERLQPLRVAAMLLGCPLLAIDERGKERRLAWWQPWRWGMHLARRALRTDALQLARGAAAAYRATCGALIAIVWLPVRLVLARLGR